MTTIIRRKRTSRTELGPYRRHELLTGKIVYPVEGYTGYGDGSGRDLAAFISNDMRADWEANRDELPAFWRSGECTVSAIFANSKPWLFAYGSPDTLPWAARVLDKGGG